MTDWANCWPESIDPELDDNAEAPIGQRWPEPLRDIYSGEPLTLDGETLRTDDAEYWS